MSKKMYKAIDFFCGGGGMTHGLCQAGIKVIAGVDFDIDAKAQLSRVGLNESEWLRLYK